MGYFRLSHLQLVPVHPAVLTAHLDQGPAALRQPKSPAELREPGPDELVPVDWEGCSKVSVKLR